MLVGFLLLAMGDAVLVSKASVGKELFMLDV